MSRAPIRRRTTHVESALSIQGFDTAASTSVTDAVIKIDNIQDRVVRLLRNYDDDEVAAGQATAIEWLLN